jgi:glycosyltransferase involved in cell wall biosynthesis
MNQWNLEKIPKIATFFWEGSTLPYLRMMSILTFHQLNPDWKIQFFYPTEIYQGRVPWKTGELDYEVKCDDHYKYFMNNFHEINKIRFDFKSIGVQNIPAAMKADFMKWYILSTVGGLMSDMDIFYLKPMTEFYKNKLEYQNTTTFTCLNNGYHSIGFLMASQNNVFYKNIFNYAKNSINLKDYQSIGSNLFGKFGLNDFNKFKTSTIENIDMATVYPIDSKNIDLIFNSNNYHMIQKNTIGLHWYAGHKLAAKYINELTNNNYKNYDNTLTHCMKYYYKDIKDLNDKDTNNFTIDNCSIQKNSNNFKIISTVKNAEKYVGKCIESVSNQTYKNWEMFVINDCSKDNSLNEILKYKDERINIINNTESHFKLENISRAIKEIKNSNDIIVMLDGDDWLYDKDVLGYLNDVYETNVWLTYGQYEPASKSYSYYCNEIDYRTYRKRAIWRTSHLKTFRKFLFDNIKREDFISKSSKQYYVTDDAAFMFPMIEMSGIHSKFISKILYVYNDLNPLVGMSYMAQRMTDELTEIINKEQYKELTLKPKVSLLFTTFNRTNLLKWNLFSLRRQNLKDKYDYEILVLDEGEETQEMKDLLKQYNDLNIVYLHTAKTKKSLDEWRIPGYAMNIGVRKCKGDYIIMGCAEIFSLNNTIKSIIEPLIKQDKLMVIPDFAKDDQKKVILDYIEQHNGECNKDILNNNCADLNVLLPFLMGVRKKEYIEIGGVCEEMKGCCRDDDLLVRMFKNNGCKYLKVNAEIVHLWHDRIYTGKDNVDPIIKARVEYNDKIFRKYMNDKKCNVGVNWGEFNG